jgi:glutathione S-transferase
VKAVLDIVKIPYEQKPLKVQFDEHKTPAFTAINPI